MEDYKNKLNKYHTILRMTAGCSNNVQGHIDSAYEELWNAYDKLTDDEKIANPIPKKEIYRNDGTDGISTGLSMVAQQEGCVIQ
jgi:hypothetical protein